MLKKDRSIPRVKKKTSFPKRTDSIEEVFERITDAFIAYDSSWHYVYLNKRAEELLGIDRKKVLGKVVWEAFPDFFNTPAGKNLRRSFRTQKIIRFEDYYPPFDTWFLTYLYPSPTGMTAYFQDITEYKKAEENNRYLAIVTQNIRDALISTDENYKILTWNKGAEELYGWTENEVRGKAAMELLHTEFMDGITRERLLQQIKKHHVWRGEVMQLTKKGNKISIFSTVAAMRNAKGVITGYVAVNRDISEQKLLDKQKEEFISMTSHELKTPVTSIKAYVQVLEKRFKENGDDKTADKLGKIDLQIDKLSVLIGDLLDTTKIQEGKLELKKEHFQFNTLLSEVVNDLEITSDRHIFRKKLGSPQMVYADKERIGQVITNFITNAIKYSPAKGTITITSSIKGNWLQCSVTDTGIGIDQNKQKHIFERFFRVSGSDVSSYPGLGLGLFISSEIIKRHGGKIGVRSEKGKGSTFYFSLSLQKPLAS